ncbi:hypothetical protein BGX34_008106 [Mortierella sp. NVP85]|nr:hypothetical protein BGX34_008106 [Mortierella sp. NVP85]
MDTVKFADAVAISNNHQIMLVEAAQLYHPDAKKRREDNPFSNTVPRRGLAMFGCTSFKNETKVMRLDYHGVFRLQQFDLFVIPLKKDDFGTKMKAAVLSCFELAAWIHQEIEYRNKELGVLGYYDRVTLASQNKGAPDDQDLPEALLFHFHDE